MLAHGNILTGGTDLEHSRFYWFVIDAFYFVNKRFNLTSIETLRASERMVSGLCVVPLGRAALAFDHAYKIKSKVTSH